MFIGQVLSENYVTLEEGIKYGGYGRCYTFRTDKSYKGDPPQFVQITTGFGGGDCGYLFDSAGSYLVYAWGSNGHYETDICTRTCSLSRASFDLLYLDRLPGISQQSIVWGSVMQYDSLTLRDIAFTPRPGFIVSTTSRGHLHETASDSRGAFSFVDLPPDSYKFNITIPDSFELLYGDSYTEIRLDSPGCAIIPLQLVPSGELSGGVYDPDGNPQFWAKVQLTPEDSAYARNSHFYLLEDHTSRQGRYRITRIPPGQYFLNVELYQSTPGKIGPPSTISKRFIARTIELGFGQHLGDVDIHLDK